MALHIRKLCVGAASTQEMQPWQDAKRARNGGLLWHVTRNWPRRRAEVLDGGSLYWVIRGRLAIRQRIIGFDSEPGETPDDKPHCRIMLDPELVLTEPRPHHPFQGWRYLIATEAPPDLRDLRARADDMPPEMVLELRGLGLL